MSTVAYVLPGVSFLLTILFFVRPRFPLGFFFMVPKLMAGGLSPYLAIVGAMGAILGCAYRAPWAIAMGAASAGWMAWYAWRCTRHHDGFERAFGANWQDSIPTARAKNMATKRWSWVREKAAAPEPRWERDIVYWTVPDTEQELLCDIWGPGDGEASGLAVIYLHGGAWYLGDKDMLTRPFMRHLATQGHVVMDVAYRLCPQVDIYGMLGDVGRAILWLKANASRYGVDPSKIVLAGASAGGHLALLAAYTSGRDELWQEDLADADLAVCGAISYYGQSDLVAVYQHTNQPRMERRDLPPVAIGPEATMSVQPGDWRMDILLGGWPQEASDTWQLASPVAHVHPGCPPTLLIQGDSDHITPIDATHAFYTKLVEAGVPAINVVFPWTDHGLDLFFAQTSPAARSALYDVDRFLALLSRED